MLRLVHPPHRSPSSACSFALWSGSSFSSRAPLASLTAALTLATVTLTGCTRSAMVRSAEASVGTTGSVTGAQAVPECDEDNAGLTVPEGFCALVFADELGATRHLVVAPSGDVFVARRASRGGGGGGVTALRDTDGDGRADVVEQFGDIGGTGINLFEGYVYLAPDDGLIRYPLPEGSLTPSGPGERIVQDLPGPGTGHAAKSAAIDPDGNVYINLGGPSNACQVQSRTAGSPGQDPCPQLENRGGTWRFDARRPGQTQADGTRFATGLRNTFALAIQPATGELWGAQHGRDGLYDLWQEMFTPEDQAEMPAEEFVHIQEGDNFGWPYCYYDPIHDVKVLAPEYGGDGTEVGRCTDMKDPAVALPAHWAPIGLAFYTGGQFPERYRGGAFIAFHGSWNRAPLPQGGYNVVFVEFDGDRPTGEWEVFAEGFAGEDVSPRGAAHRPAGVAVGPDGSLYVSDDQGGRIYRMVYTGG